MAYDDDGAMLPVAGHGRARIVHLAGAAASLTLVVGMVVWGYQLAVRDVHGIPVVRALEGPMRVAPAAPGGEVTEHQGLAINQVAANGIAAGLPDTVTLAPRPAELADEDVAGLIGPQEPPPDVVTASAAQLPPAQPVMPADAATAAAINATLAEATATDPVAPLGPAVDTGDLPARAAFRPVPRPPLPAPIAQTPPPATDAPPAATPALVEVDPANVAPGTILIQLDAFDSATDARAGWATIVSRFPAEFADKALLLDESQSGGLPFWRLRATGFDSVEAARGFCETLRAGGTTCIPVAHE